jgi:hypothetical protein
MAALFFVLTGLLMVIGYGIGLYFGDPLGFMLIGLGFAGVLNFVSYYWSDSIVVKMSGAKIIQQSDNPALFAVVQEVASKAGIPMPRVGIVNSPQPNAFATGRGPQKAVVVATSSILQILTPTELEAVIGHEIGHVVHRDVLTSSVAATIAGVISYIGNIALYSMMFGGMGGERKQQAGRQSHRVRRRDNPRPPRRHLRQARNLPRPRVQRGRVRREADPEPGRSGLGAPEDQRKGADQRLFGGRAELTGRSIASHRVALDSEPFQGEHDARAIFDPPIDAAQGREAEKDRPADGRLRPVAKARPSISRSRSQRVS